ncbi:hypothetical protein GGP56_002550 [Salinibacter ruber]|nr:hypothetical protein [Salinibacter ruber]
MRRKACFLVKHGTSQNRRNLPCRKFGKRNVIVRSTEQEEGECLAVVREKEGNEYPQPME